MERREDSYTVTFEVSGRPDESGLRIRSTQPRGLYVSSKDAGAAKWFFERFLLELLPRRNVFSVAPGEGARVEPCDWAKHLLEGKGEIVIRRMSREEVLRTVKDSVPEPKHEVQLKPVGFRTPLGAQCYILGDPDSVDGWVMVCIQEDLAREKGRH